MTKIKHRKYEKGTETRRLARIAIGTPKSTKVIPDARNKPLKHKKLLIEEL